MCTYLDPSADATLGNISFIANLYVLEDRAVQTDLFDHRGQSLIVGHLVLPVLVYNRAMLDQ